MPVPTIRSRNGALRKNGGPMTDGDRPGTVLSTSGLTRHFGRFRAVDDVSITIRRGSVTGLIGPNGAGKTTLFSMIAGELRRM